MSKPPGQRYTIAVDFDGVIHAYTESWMDAVTIPDPPAEGAIEWLQEMRESFNVAIFTTRAKSAEGRIAVREWLGKHGFEITLADIVGGRVIVTNIKPPALIYLDDRAWRFEGPGTFPTKKQIHDARPWNKPRGGDGDS